jgi:nitroreductase
MIDGRDAVQFVLQRHSVREYTGEPVKPEDVETMMEAVRWAPSAGNVQPWHFYVVTNREAVAALAKAAYGQRFVAEAGVVFVVCADPEQSAARYGERGRDLYGYGACWVGAFDEKKARRALSVPGHLRPVAIVPVGPARPVSRHPDRRPASTLFDVIE